MVQNRFNDLGLGTKATRLVNKNGTFNVRRKRQPLSTVNLYQNLVKMPWVQFQVLTLLTLFICNLLFAAVYYILALNN